MTYTAHYWYKNPTAPFYEFLSTLASYSHNVSSYDELIEIVNDPESGDWRIRFKEEHRTLLLDPGQLPHPGALNDAAGGMYDDGDARSFLRRLWRDLYHGEPVPGGDDEFRDDIRKLIHGEVDRVPFTVSYYDDRPVLTSTNDVEELQALGRRIWQRFYPDEPLP